ncbi:hypothetical protein O1M63_12260 [Streptomyces mirabilis]|nr:hypothetical protein [Streptomyces mirabilis]
MSDKTTEPTHPTGGGPGNLPPETHSFVGRREELRWLETELDPSVGIHRLLSVVGVGGVGKTRLALRALARLQEAYPDGVWLVELSPLHTAGLVGLAVVETLRLTDQSTGPVTEVVAEWAYGKRLLLVLDSCEHVLADCAALVETLLPALPGLRVLVTSREPLGLPGELVLPLDPLPVADDAVTLFADRAALTGFTLDDTNRPTVESVCRRLDGIPLALELAAARLCELSLAQLHGRLGERLPSRLDLLSAPHDGAGPPRHQTLRTAIGWSHELCAPLERLLWARLWCSRAASARRRRGDLRGRPVARRTDRRTARPARRAVHRAASPHRPGPLPAPRHRPGVRRRLAARPRRGTRRTAAPPRPLPAAGPPGVDRVEHRTAGRLVRTHPHRTRQPARRDGLRAHRPRPPDRPGDGGRPRLPVAALRLSARRPALPGPRARHRPAA